MKRGIIISIELIINNLFFLVFIISIIVAILHECGHYYYLNRYLGQISPSRFTTIRFHQIPIMFAVINDKRYLLTRNQSIKVSLAGIIAGIPPILIFLSFDSLLFWGMIAVYLIIGCEFDIRSMLNHLKQNIKV